MIYLRRRHAKEINGEWIGTPAEYYLSAYPLNKNWSLLGYEKTNPGYCEKCHQLREQLKALNNERLSQGKPPWKNLSEIYKIECFDIPIYSVNEKVDDTDFRSTLASKVVADMTNFPDISKTVVWNDSWSTIKEKIAVQIETDDEGNELSRTYPEYIIGMTFSM